MAPGAQRGHLQRSFSATAINVSSAIVAGLALSFASCRIFARLVEDNSPDAVTLVAGTLPLAAFSATAYLVPALCASQVDPMAALRTDKGDRRRGGN
jgi:hypothetical protein